MPVRNVTVTVETTAEHQVVDITRDVESAVREAGVEEGQCCVYIPHATAAIAINENADPNIGVDLMRAMRAMVPDHDDWLHDRIDNNAAAHIKAVLVGPSETIPITKGRLTLGTWQNVFVCEFDGPRRRRDVVVSVWS